MKTQWNFKKLLIGIIIVNIVSWLMLEFWINRYSGGVGEIGAGFMVFCQLAGYHIVNIASRHPVPIPEPIIPEITPINCPEHKWYTKYGSYHYHDQQCIICKAERTDPDAFDSEG